MMPNTTLPRNDDRHSLLKDVGTGKVNNVCRTKPLVEESRLYERIEVLIRSLEAKYSTWACILLPHLMEKSSEVAVASARIVHWKRTAGINVFIRTTN